MTQPQNKARTEQTNYFEPSPYDTGERCEARPWIRCGEQVTQATPAESFGKVDFDNDEGSTICVVYVERRSDTGYAVHVQSLCGEGEVDAVVHLEVR